MYYTLLRLLHIHQRTNGSKLQILGKSLAGPAVIEMTITSFLNVFKPVKTVQQIVSI